MAQQNVYDDGDWDNWGSISSPTQESLTNGATVKSSHIESTNKFVSPKKDNSDEKPSFSRHDQQRNNSNNDEERNEIRSERRPYNNRNDEVSNDSGRRDFNDRRSNNDGERREFKPRENNFSNGRNDNDGHERRNVRNDDRNESRLSGDFKDKAKINDGHSRMPNREHNDNEVNGDEPPITKRATYVPDDDAEDYALHVNSGINFDNYEKIPVEVTGENIPKPISKFNDFQMPDFLIRNIEDMKYTKLTPVQKYAIPIIDSNRDLMACAQTGSGKTAAFLLPIIASLHKTRIETETSTANVAFPKALIMTPTRELCRQIFTAARQLCRGSDLKCAYIYGGIEMNKSRKILQSSGCDILVATPGRLIHFLELVWVNLRYLRYFVLDEGDRMLDKDGFYESVNKITEQANFLGKDRIIQISMFSATFPNEIQNLAKTILKNYLFLAVGMVGSASCDVKQEIIRADQKDKMNLAIEYIKSIPNDKALIFVQSKRMADFFGIKLDYLGYKATTIHGDREQEQREIALNDFKSGRVNFMVATNVAARGLDIPMVDTVINIDMPDDIDTYVHRIGRTGRCGNVGRAVSFFDENNDIALAGPLLSRLREANQECPDWLVAMSDGSGIGTRRGPIRDNRREMKVQKFVETPNQTFMKGSNADYNDDWS